MIDFCFEHFTEGERLLPGDATFAPSPTASAFFRLLDRIEGVPYSYNIQTRADSLTPAVLARLRELTSPPWPSARILNDPSCTR